MLLSKMKAMSRAVEEAEGKARHALADLLALMGEVPEADIPEVAALIEKAREKAKEKLRQATTKRLRPEPDPVPKEATK